MEEHDNISERTATMYGHVQHLSKLEYKIPDDLAVDGVLQSLHPSYKSFIHVYHMQEKYLTFSKKLTVVITVKMKVRRYEVGHDDRVSHISTFAYDGCKPCCPRKTLRLVWRA
jgi:hypothetical protein